MALSEARKTACALVAARTCPEIQAHLEQVERLAVGLFDAFAPLHHMGLYERGLVSCAALLHDIGISVSFKGHHKHSRRLIMRADLPAITTREREIVANVARYHRKARPSSKHKAFRVLPRESQDLVSRLAAILRIADGLDRAHENQVTEVRADCVSPTLWTLKISGGGDLQFAAWAARRKAGFFEDLYNVRLLIKPKSPGS